MPRHHADWLKAYLDYTSDTEPPVAYRFWSGVSTIASTLRRKVYIDQHFFKWIPNFYIIFVSPPGLLKSTTVGMGREFLDEIPGVTFGPGIMTWQTLPKVLREAVEMVPNGDGFDVTAPVTFTVSELGTLIDPKDKQMIDVLVDNWDAKEVLDKRTKASGDDRIDRPWINILSGTTPSWLQEHYPKHMIGGGFTSRCIFIFTNKKERLIAYPGDFMNDQKRALKKSLIEDLTNINSMVGIYKLSNEAREWGTSWYKKNYEEPPESTLGSDLVLGMLSRRQSHVHKLAMILAAARTNDLIITQKDLSSASQIIASLQPDLEQIFSTLHTTRGQATTERLWKTVHQKGKILQSSLYRLFVNSMNTKEFYEALVSAEMAGYIRREGSIVYAVRMKGTSGTGAAPEGPSPPAPDDKQEPIP